MLDRAARTGLVARNCRINSAIERDDEGSGVLYCTVWPERNGAAEPAYLIIEFREASQGDLTHDLQRTVAERMLLSALEQRDLASGVLVAPLDLPLDLGGYTYYFAWPANRRESRALQRFTEWLAAVVDS